MKKQQLLLQKFKFIIKQKKLSHIYLIEGISEEAKHEFMLELVNEFLQTSYFNPKLEKLIKKFSYPNFYYLSYKDNNSIKKEQILDMQNYFNQTSFFQQKKVYVIEGIEHLHVKAANSLLYFLENPISENILGILLTNNRYLVLPTILSRAQVFSLDNVYDEEDEEKVSFEGVTLDVLDDLLIILLTRFANEKKDVLKNNYYLKFKKFFLFFLDNFTKNNNFIYLFVKVKYLIEDKLFVSDFLKVIIQFFLDLYYKKNNLSFSFPIYLLEKPFFNELSLEDVNKFLEIFTQIVQKNAFINDNFCFMALLLAIEKQKEFLNLTKFKNN
jgi:DNA polymerase-3 subunit delta'